MIKPVAAALAYPAIDNLPPVHPGEFLRDELDALGMSASEFADRIEVPPNAVTAILNGTRGISAGMALRLARVFGTSEQYWLNLNSLGGAERLRPASASSTPKETEK